MITNIEAMFQNLLIVFYVTCGALMLMFIFENFMGFW